MPLAKSFTPDSGRSSSRLRRGGASSTAHVARVRPAPGAQIETGRVRLASQPGPMGRPLCHGYVDSRRWGLEPMLACVKEHRAPLSLGGCHRWRSSTRSIAMSSQCRRLQRFGMQTPWIAIPRSQLFGGSRSSSLHWKARARADALCSNDLRARGTIFMHRFNRLLRILRTTARTRARLSGGKECQPMKARGRGVSQGWALSETQQRVQVRGCSPAESFRE